MPEVPVYTAAQVRAAEAPLLASGAPLMRRAAAALATVIGEELRQFATPTRVLVLAGGGDNGGDALFAAAELIERSVREPAADAARPSVDVFLAGTRVHEAGLAAATAAGVQDVDAAEAQETDYGLVVDGVLGTGTTGEPTLRGTVRGVVTALLPRVRAHTARVVAVDLPSGLHPDDGTSGDGLVLPADVTVTFGGVKAGLVRAAGPSLAGRVVLVDIGLGERLAAVEPAGTASVFRTIVAPDVTDR